MQKLTRFLALLGELMVEKPKTLRRRLLSLTIATTRCHRASNVGFRWPTASCSCNSPHCFWYGTFRYFIIGRLRLSSFDGSSRFIIGDSNAMKIRTVTPQDTEALTQLLNDVIGAGGTTAIETPSPPPNSANGSSAAAMR